MINKNKEEIESFGCGLDITLNRAVAIDLTFCGDGILCDVCEGLKRERIKTSILWCEDEIKFLKRLKECNYPIEPRGRLFEFITVEKRVEQLQTHLKWLKEQEQTE